MSARLPLLILDEIMLPGTTGEVGLEPREAEFLISRGAGEREIPVLVACRVPGSKPPTALEQKVAGSPGELLEAALLGEGLVVPPDEDDPIPRLVLSETRRVRTVDVAATAGGWEAAATSWPIEAAGVPAADVEALASRFYRALLVSRGADSEGIRAQVEGPISEIEARRDLPVERLMLLADYLFDSGQSRQASLLVADGAELCDQVTDALDLLDTGLPGGRRAVGESLRVYLQEAAEDGLGSMTRAAHVLRAVTPLVTSKDRDLSDAQALATDLESLQERFDSLAERLLRASHRGGPKR